LRIQINVLEGSLVPINKLNELMADKIIKETNQWWEVAAR